MSTFKKPSKLNVFICDVSGSMYYSLSQLSQDLQKIIKSVPDGDALLIGIFSSPGYFKWIVNRVITTQDDRAKVEDVILRELRVQGMTCFSEILLDTPAQLNTFLTQFPTVVFNFMSDGIPTVYDLTKEKAAIEEACKTLSTYITGGNVFSYGNYADRVLLGKMASLLGIQLVTANSIDQVSTTIHESFTYSFKPKKAVKIKNTGANFITFSTNPVDGVGVVVYDSTSSINVDEDTIVYNLDITKTAETYRENIFLIKALLKVSKLAEAKNIASMMGEVFVYRILSLIFNNAHYVLAESALDSILWGNTAHFSEGCVPDCQPDPNAFDILDLLTTLTSDDFDGAAINFDLERNPFNYKTIGRGSTVKEGYPTFTRNPGEGLALNRLVYHAQNLNLSIAGDIKGTINLPNKQEINGTEVTLEEVKLPSPFPTHKYRTYSLIADGKLNVTAIPVTLTEVQFETLQKEIGDDVQPSSCGKGYVIYLNNLPFINQSKTAGCTDLQQLVDFAEQAFNLGLDNKVVKYLLNELDPEKSHAKPTEYTDLQNDYLTLCGISNSGSFNPPSTVEPPIDKIEISTLAIKLPLSSSATMESVLERVEKNSKLGPDEKKLTFNLVQQRMADTYGKLKAQLPKTKGEAVVFLSNINKQLTSEIRSLQFRVNSQRMALAVTGKWAETFREDVQTRTTTLGKREATVTFGTDTELI